MKEKLFRTVTTLILILCLISLDFVLLGYNVVLALSDSGISGDVSTNIQNVEFDAYFKQENTNLYEKQVDVANEDILYLRINVKNKGVLNNAKIQLDNVNFNVLKDKTQNEYIQDINTNSNEITLKSITAGNDIEIGLSIQFKKQETFDANYFGQENTIKISGTYQDEQEQELSGERKVKINWIGNIDVMLTENIDKYFSLNEKGVLLQQNILTEVQENRLPREKETLSINVPVIKEQKPTEVYAILNGKKMSDENVIYNQENSTLEIVNEKTVDTENKLTWGSAQNQYKVIYIYPSEIGEDNNTIEVNTTLKSKLFTKDEIQKQDTQSLEIAKVGNLLDIQKNSLQQQIYKGYLYANVQNEVAFEEEEKVDIAYADAIENVQIDTLDNQFANDANQEFTAGTSVNYKGIVVNKQNMVEILGEEGSITIQDENGNVISTINNSIEPNENGDIDITYDGNRKNIKVITSKPITEGRLVVKHKKAISGTNDYTKDELKTFTKLISRSKVTTSIGEIIGETAIALMDTKTDAKLELSNTSFSTLQTNENVQFLVTLNSNNEQYDLFKNPMIEIVIPKELNINVKNITQLNGQGELSIASPSLIENDDGTKTIAIHMQGEQTTFGNNINQGIQISIIADITIDKTIPSMSSQIEMRYTNENRAGEQFSYQLPTTINSKYGVLLINKLSNYNANGDVLENVDDKTKEIVIDANTQEKIANQEVIIINNYENDISNVSLTGKFPEDTTENINNEEFKATFGMELVENIVSTGKTAKIYYSEDVNATKDSDTWQETVEDFSTIKSFKVEIEDNKLEPGATLSVNSQISIPENIEYNQSTYIPLALNYDYLGNQMTSYSNISLQTAENDEIMTEEENIQETVGDLSVQVSAKSGDKVLKEGEEVKEGQGIKYTVTLTNNSNQDINNVKMTAKQSNAIFYDEVVYHDGWDSVTDTTSDYTHIEEVPDLTEKTEQIDTIAVGESKTFEYQISVKEIEEANATTKGDITISADDLEEKTINTPELNIVDSEIKVTLANSYMEEYPVQSDSLLPVTIKVYNLSDSVQENVLVKMKLPEALGFDTSEIVEGDFVEYENDIVTFRIDRLETESTIQVGLITENIDLSKTEENVELYCEAEANDKAYISNSIERTIYQSKSTIIAEQTGSITSDTVKTGDNLIYTIKVRNEGPKERYVNITDSVPAGAEIQDVYLLYNGERTEITNINGSDIYHTQLLNVGDEIELVIDTVINVEKIVSATITNSVNVSVVGNVVSCNSITYKVEGREDYPEEDLSTHNITGVAWVDENRNGTRESNEQKLSNILVMLLNEESGIAVDNVVTNYNGEYEFLNVERGNYLVVFVYDTTQYAVAEYQKSGVSENANSDVISKEIELDGINTQVAITKTLSVDNVDLTSIDAGFVTMDRFDLKLDKSISKVIVQNSAGTTVQQYSKEKLAKIEIDARRINNSMVIIEYNIDITNEGQVPGYVTEIIDYKPDDVTFNSEMNKNWYQSTDGEIYTKELANQIINPGETKTVTLTLMKNMNQNNTGTIQNIAEIHSDSNDYSLDDMDSIPANNNMNEDDISIAEAIVSIRTGAVVMYVSLVFIIVAILGIGIYLINKKVLKNDDEEIL